MKLINKTLEKRFAKVGRQEGKENPIVIAHYFNPTGVGDWYATEYYPESKEFFGYANLGDDEMAEWGYFSLEELEGYHGKFGLGIERDIYFHEQPINNFIKK